MTKVSINILGKVHEAKGKDVLEALQGIALSWDQIKGKGVMYVTRGKKSHEHLFQMRILRRMFSNKIMLAHWAKNLEFLIAEDVKTNIPS